MEQSEQLKSILAADFGAAHTRVVLIELVKGQYRMVASARVRTTLAPPYNDVSVGLLWAIDQLVESTQRQFYDEEGLIFPETDGAGVDKLWITSSAGRPLTAVLLGLMPNVSISSAMRAMTGTYVNVAAQVSVGDQRDEQTQINQILQVNPDLLFVSGGTDGGNAKTVLDMVQLAALAVQLAPADERPTVIYAGNRDLVPRVQEVFAAIENARLIIANNVRPGLMQEDVSNARIELARAFGDYIARQAGGFEAFAQVGIQPTAQGVASLIRWLGEETETVAMHLDIGSATSTLIYGRNKSVVANIYSELGLGQSMLEAVQRIGYDAISDWLPFEISEAALLNYAHNKSLKPDTVPQNTGDMLVELAIMRAIVQHMVAAARQQISTEDYQVLSSPSPLILSGAMLTDGLHPGVAALLAVESLELFGVIDIYTDPYSIVPVLGSIAYEHPEIAVQVYDNHGVNLLGTAFCPVGKTRGKAMTIEVTYNNGTTAEHVLESGEVLAVGGIVGGEVDVDIRLSRGLKLAGKRRWKQKVRLGTAGVVFDARGRPLPDLAPEKRAAAYQTLWNQASLGQAAITVPESHEMDANAEDIKARRREVDALKNALRKAVMEAEQREAVFGDIDRAAAEKSRQRNRAQQRQGDSSDLDDLLNQL